MGAAETKQDIRIGNRPAAARRLSRAPAFLVLPLLFAACVFETSDDPVRTPTRFDLDRLEAADNPLARSYAVETRKSMVGLKFAFRTMRYAFEVDSNVAAFHAQTGVHPALVGAYFDLSSQPKNIRTFLESVRGHGAVPYVTLDPKDFDEKDKALQKTFLARILAGEFDASLRAQAAVLRDFGHPVLLRYAHEMNGEWYPYAGGGDADGDDRADGPEVFVRAWRHVHDLFSAEGAENLLWVFCPNAEDFPAADWNRPFRYFPGPGYADYVFVDAYEHHDKRTQSLEQALVRFYDELGDFLDARFADGDSTLPAFGLGEFGTNRIQPGAKEDWYAESLGYLGADARIKFHILYNSRNLAEDFSLAGLGERIREAYRNARFQFRLFAPTEA